MCGLVTSCAASSQKLNTYSHVCFYLLDVFTFHILIYKTQRQIMCLCEKGGCVLQLLMLLRFQNYISTETSAKLINFHPRLTLSEVILELSWKWDGCVRVQPISCQCSLSCAYGTSASMSDPNIDSLQHKWATWICLGVTNLLWFDYAKETRPVFIRIQSHLHRHSKREKQREMMWTLVQYAFFLIIIIFLKKHNPIQTLAWLLVWPTKKESLPSLLML